MIFTLSSCQSADKEDAKLTVLNEKYDYDAAADKTYVTWEAIIDNCTIYNINSFKINFKLYSGTDFIGANTYDYNAKIKHGDNYYTNTFNFSVDGKIDRIEINSWYANYGGIWDAYKVWFIIIIIVTVIASGIYIFCMIIADIDFDDVIFFVEDICEYWYLLLLIPAVGVGVAIFSSWVPPLIIFGGVLVFALTVALSHLVKFIVEEMPCWGFGTAYDDEDEENDDLDLSGMFNFDNTPQADYSDLFDEEEDDEEEIDFKKTQKRKKKNGITFASIAGLDEAKKAFKEKVVYAFEHRDLYKKYGKKAGGGLLLYGLPGTGKTMFAEAAANETDALFIPIKCSDIKSKWYGESEQKVKKIFAEARRAKKAIIFFDEFEAIGAKRTDDSDNGNNDLVPQILAEMQGINSGSSNAMILVIAATNKPWSIDSAFLRPGRFDEKIYIPLPDFEARKKLFELNLSSIPHNELDFAYLSKITDGFNGADIGEFCDKLKMLAINRTIETGTETPISMADVQTVKELVKSSVSNEDIERLESFMK